MVSMSSQSAVCPTAGVRSSKKMTMDNSNCIFYQPQRAGNELPASWGDKHIEEDDSDNPYVEAAERIRRDPNLSAAQKREELEYPGGAHLKPLNSQDLIVPAYLSLVVGT